MVLIEGSVAAAADHIQMTIDELKNIANSKMPGIQDDASRSRDKFRNMALSAGAFSEFPAAQALERQHEGVHEVFIDTINGVIADLESFQQKLRESVGSAEATDEQVEASLVALGRRLSSNEHVYRSEHDYTRSNKEHYDDLTAQTGTADAEATEASPAESEPREPAEEPGQSAKPSALEY